MKPNLENLTLRQRYEAARQKTTDPVPMTGAESLLLASMLGKRVSVWFHSGNEVTGLMTAMDEFSFLLGTSMVVFKHSVQTVTLVHSKNHAFTSGRPTVTTEHADTRTPEDGYSNNFLYRDIT